MKRASRSKEFGAQALLFAGFVLAIPSVFFLVVAAVALRPCGGVLDTMCGETAANAVLNPYSIFSLAGIVFFVFAFRHASKVWS